MGLRSRVWFAAVLLACAVACAPRNAPVAAAPTPAAPAPAQAVAEQLPQGAGRQILMSACTSCHNLREVTKFSGFYGREQWRDIVLTMMDYGAPVNAKEVEVLSEYLTSALGKKP
ncbi:MAG: c-type cytochrome [Vicinamibacterales bacterium]